MPRPRITGTMNEEDYIKNFVHYNPNPNEPVWIHGEETKPKRGRPKKQSLLKKKVLKGKEKQIMDATSKAHKVGDQAVISTDMNITKGLSPKDKKALEASVKKALQIAIKGGMLKKDVKDMIDGCGVKSHETLSLSSSDESGSESDSDGEIHIDINSHNAKGRRSKTGEGMSWDTKRLDSQFKKIDPVKVLSGGDGIKRGRGRPRKDAGLGYKPKN